MAEVVTGLLYENIDR